MYKKQLIDSVRNIYLTVDSSIEVNNIINDSSHIILRKVNLNPYGFEKYIWKKT